MLGLILALLSGLGFFIYMTIFYLPIILFSGEEKSARLTRREFKKFGTWILGSIGTKLEVIYEDREAVENLKAEDGIVVVGNHQSNMDIPVLLAGLPFITGYVAKKEMETWPFFGVWMKKSHCVFLDRSNPREGIKSIKRAVEVIKAGYPITIFPEGERSKTGEIGEFKKGSFKLATETKGIIVPVTIKGTYEIQRRGSAITKMGKTVKLIVSKPIYVKDMSVAEIKKLDKIVRDIVVENFEKF
ncbi:lysophospholipid acyltransferase family protein [Ilyobacter sp.]|uniref:lysophospholipid acyltransferase family protein n=1 Tax=Ilyobacter sp. TaxID=3100343 RepID=UPI0035629A25